VSALPGRVIERFGAVDGLVRPGRELMDVLYRVNPSGAAALIARQMKGLIAP
jgi:hypothetical protein